MSTAFVLLNCELGAEHAVLDEMNGLAGVSEAVRVNGVYDIVVKVTDKSREHISKVVRKIRSVANVKSILTMVVTEDPVEA
jgi:DNA-binding Lrp family transcriptional regulator